MAKAIVCGNCSNNILGTCDVINEEVDELDGRAGGCASFSPLDDGDFIPDDPDDDIDIDMEEIESHGIDTDDDLDDSEAYEED